MKRALMLPLAALVVWGMYLLKANVWFRLYPAVMVAAAFTAFFVSLFRTPLCEAVARRMSGELDERGVRYCRKLTVVWTAFLGCHLAVTVATVFMPMEVWAVYNGFVAYVLMGSLALGEFVYRKRVLGV